MKVKPQVATYRLSVEVLGLNNKRTNKVGVTVTNRKGKEFSGSFDKAMRWLADDKLPKGKYYITLQTPKGTVAMINDRAKQFAKATDKKNVFSIELNRDNAKGKAPILGAFKLVKVKPKEVTYRLGVKVTDLDGKLTDKVEVMVTNEDGVMFSGSYNKYLQWLTDDKLSKGLYTITLNTPEGTIAKIDNSAKQFAEPTDEENVFTIRISKKHSKRKHPIFGIFKLVAVETEEPVTPEEPEKPEEPETPEEPEEPNGDDEEPTDTEEPDDEDVETPVEDDEPAEDDEVVSPSSLFLPQTGVAPSAIGLALTSLVTGLGLLVFNKKRKN